MENGRDEVKLLSYLTCARKDDGRFGSRSLTNLDGCQSNEELRMLVVF